MGAQFIKHIIWDDLATSGWKHLFPMQSNLKKFEEIWRFILLIRSLSRRCARRQNLNVVVWVRIEYYGRLYLICFHLQRRSYNLWEHFWRGIDTFYLNVCEQERKRSHVPCPKRDAKNHSRNAKVVMRGRGKGKLVLLFSCHPFIPKFRRC